MSETVDTSKSNETAPILDPACGTGVLSIENYNRVRIRYPRATRIENMIDYSRTASKQSFEPHCLLVTGLSGVGKSSLIQEYLAKHPRRDVAGGTVIPVLFQQIPRPATIKAMLTHLLNALGEPTSTHGTTEKLTLRLIHLIKECKVELIILDEFQHFMEQKNARGMREVSDWLKNLINWTKVPIVLVGMPDCTDVLRENPQLMSRFSAQVLFAPFEWRGERKQEFMRFLDEIAKSLPLKIKPELQQPELAQRIFWATEGRSRPLFRLIHKATEKSVLQGWDTIKLEALSEAYRESLAAAYRDDTDPFLGPLPEIGSDGIPVRRAASHDTRDAEKVLRRPESKKGSSSKDFTQMLSGTAR